MSAMSSSDLAGVSVLFLCTGNSCRSHMAEGFARRAYPGGTFHSAGMTPSGRVDPRAVAVMAERGVDLSGHRSKALQAEFLERGVPLDYVVTVCGDADENCPAFNTAPPYTATRILHAGFDDPPRLAATAADEQAALAHYRRVRDEIEAFIADLPAKLKTLKYR